MLVRALGEPPRPAGRAASSRRGVPSSITTTCAGAGRVVHRLHATQFTAPRARSLTVNDASSSSPVEPQGGPAERRPRPEVGHVRDVVRVEHAAGPSWSRAAERHPPQSSLRLPRRPVSRSLRSVPIAPQSRSPRHRRRARPVTGAAAQDDWRARPVEVDPPAVHHGVPGDQPTFDMKASAVTAAASRRTTSAWFDAEYGSSTPDAPTASSHCARTAANAGAAGAGRYALPIGCAPRGNRPRSALCSHAWTPPLAG